MTVFTDGSRGSSGVGAGISFNGLSEELSIPLGQIPSVFEADISYLQMRYGIKRITH